MSGGIFLLDGEGHLVEMKEHAYDSEELLQRLLAQYPHLLAGDQVNSAAPRRWLLISREMSLPSEEDGAGRWSVDHLFLDQDGIPTLVEVKRSSDTRIRREVVGQMLDYASNAVLHWPVATVRTRFEAHCAATGADPSLALGEFLGLEVDPDEFWETVKTNLQAGKVRLIFVADEIPVELRRVVEFLNGQMDPAQVLAIEIKQYVGSGMRSLVPRLIGETEKARQKKGSSGQKSGQWDEGSFLSSVDAIKGEQGVRLIRRILAWSIEQGLYPWWSTSSVPLFSITLDCKAQRIWPISIWLTNRNAFAEIGFSRLAKYPGFIDERRRQELKARLNSIPGVHIKSEDIVAHPNISLDLIKNDPDFSVFFDIVGWIYREIAESC